MSGRKREERLPTFTPMGRRAFTLIELMIVIAIIAVLAAVLIPNFIRARAQSILAGCESNERNVATALESYAIDNSGTYPTPVGGTLPTPAANGWGNYVNVNPTCPQNKTVYVYTTNADLTVFTIKQGPAGQQVHVVLGIPANYPLYDSSQGLTP